MAALIETVKKESGSLLEIWEIFKDFELQCFTTEEQSFTDFHVGWRTRLQSLQEVGLTYPENILALKLIMQSKLDQDDVTFVVAALQSQLDAALLAQLDVTRQTIDQSISHQTNMLEQTAEMLQLHFESKTEILVSRKGDDKKPGIVSAQNEKEKDAAAVKSETEADCEDFLDPNDFEDKLGDSEDVMNAAHIIEQNLKLEIETDDILQEDTVQDDILQEDTVQDDILQDDNLPGDCDTPPNTRAHGKVKCDGCYGYFTAKHIKEHKMFTCKSRSISQRHTVESRRVEAGPEDIELFNRTAGRCPRCARPKGGFANPLRLKRHLLHCSSVVKCDICAEEFSSRDDCEKHKESCMAVCEICFKEFRRKHDLNWHYGMVHKERSFACPECDKGFPSLPMLNKHVKSHERQRERDSRKYKCDKCGHDSKDWTAFFQHNRIHGEFKCEPCCAYFKSEKKMLLHIANHKVLKCEECDLSFFSRDKYRRHMQTARHGGARKYQCDQCEKSFLRNQMLERHYISSHTNDRKHECTECGKKFHFKDKLIQHFRIHTGERPYECEVCHKRFTQSGDKSKHMKTHNS